MMCFDAGSSSYNNPEADTLVDTVPIGEKNIKKKDEYTPFKNIYFAFIDVLGFKDSFLEIEKKKKLSKSKDKYELVFLYFFRLMEGAKSLRKGGASPYFGQVSDSLYFYTTNIECLMEFIKIFAFVNHYAMQHDVFFRGGIAKGNLKSKQMHQYYGSSIIKAYLLEENIAKYPRVSIDYATYSDIKDEDFKREYIEEHEDDENRRELRTFPFIKDIDVYKEELEFEDLAAIEEIKLDVIKKNIKQNKMNFERDDKTYNKYSFLEREMNNFLKKQKKGE